MNTAWCWIKTTGRIYWRHSVPDAYSLSVLGGVSITNETWYTSVCQPLYGTTNGTCLTRREIRAEINVRILQTPNITIHRADLGLPRDADRHG